MALDKNLLSDEEVVIGKTSLLSDDEVDLSVEKKNEPISGGSGVSQPDLKRQSVPSTVSGTKAKAEIDKRMSQPITLGDESRQMGIAKSDMGMPSREEQLVKADVVTNQNEYRTIEKNLSGKVKTQREKEKELQNKLKISQYIQKLIGDSGNVVEGEGAPMVEEDIDLDIFVPIKFEIDELQPEKISENANPELRDRVILKNSKEARQKTYDFENVIKPNISLVKKRSDAKALLQKTNEDINKLSQDLNTINEEVEGDITKARSKNKLAMVELGIPDSFALGVTESIKAIDLSKAMASGDDDKVGAILEDAYIQNRLYGDRKTSQISQMLGGQAVPLGVSFATAIVSGGNPLLTAGVTSSVYGGMGAGMSATQAYIELRNQGKSQAEALDVAKNMAIVGGVGGVAEGVIGTTLQAGKIASKVLGLNKGFAKTLVTAMAEAGVDGTAAMGVQASDNLFAIANGIDRKVSDGVLEQGAMEVAFGAGYQVLFKGASKLTPKTYKKLVNEYAKFSTVIHQQVIDKAVKDGVISASDAKPILDDIVASSNAQQKLQGVEIPEKAVDDVIDLQKQLDVLEEQKKTASPAALPAIEGKIEQLSSEIQIKAAIPLTAKEKTELNKLQTAKDSNTEYDKERLKFLEDRQKSSLKAIKEADEVAQRLELAEMKKLQESKREIELSVEPKVKQESIIKQENLEENLGKTVSVNNKTGVLAKEGENRYVVEGDGFVFEINNESVVVDKTPAPKKKKTATLVDNKVDIDGTSYDLVSVNKDNNDKVVSLTLKKDNGQSITIRDEDLALDIAIAQKEQSLGIKPTETAPVQEETKVVEAQQPTQETGVEPAVSNSKGVEIVEDTEYTEFIDKGKVTPERLNDIANKVKNREQLSPRETEIFSDKTGEINKIIATQEQPKAEAETLKPNDKAVIQGVDVNIPDAKTQEILKEERNEKPYFDKEVEKLDNSTLSEEEVNALLDRDDVAILTGTNPDNNAVDDATNVRLNQEAEKWLKEKGYKYHPTAGKYNQAENSFIVEGITVADAIEFAKVFKQESVAHSEGLVYKNGEINPRVREGDRSNVDTSNPDENFVSAVKTKDGKVIGFQFGIDFDTTNKYEKPKEAPKAEKPISRKEKALKAIEEKRLAKAKEAIASVKKALQTTGIEVVDDPIQYQKAIDEGNGQKGMEGMFVADDGKIYLDSEKLKGEWGKTIVFHEGTHPVVNIIRNTNKPLYNSIISGLKKASETNADIREVMDWANENYGAEGEGRVEDETIVETIARIGDGRLKLNEIPKSLRQSVIDLVNKVGKMLGFDQVLSDTDPVAFKKMAEKIATALVEGDDISKIVGEENVGKYDAPIGEPTQLSVSRDIKYEPIELSPNGHKLSLVEKSDLIDIELLIKDIANKRDKVFFWVADQLGKGMYKDARGKIHNLDAGVGHALDKNNRKKGEIWASGLPEKRINKLIGDSKYIFIVSGSETASKRFNKKVFDVFSSQVGDFGKFKKDVLSVSKVGKLNKVLSQFNSFDELRNSVKRKELLNVIEQQKGKKTPLFDVLNKHNAFLDYDAMRDGFFKDNNFKQGDVMLVLKGKSAGGETNHSTYSTAVYGDVIGIPNKKVNSYDLMPEKFKAENNLGRSQQSAKVAPYGVGIREIQASKGGRKDYVKETYYEPHMTETKDKKNYVFFHVSGADKKSIQGGINSRTFNSTRTSKEEKGLQYGVASYYTKPNDGERMVSGDKYAVYVPKDKVYPMDTDPNGYKSVAEEKISVGTPFRGEKVKSEMAEMAKKDGYEMAVGEWHYSRVGEKTDKPLFRADALVALKPQKEMELNYSPATKKDIQYPDAQSLKTKKAIVELSSEIAAEKSINGTYDKAYSIAKEISDYGGIVENYGEPNETVRNPTKQEIAIMTKGLKGDLAKKAKEIQLSKGGRNPDLDEYYDDYVEVAKAGLEENKNYSIEDLSKDTGYSVDDLKEVWDEASGKQTKVEEKSIFETHDETKGASKKDKVLSEYEKENPEKAQRVREIIDNFEDMKTMLQTKIDNGEITNLKIEC